MKKFVKYLIGIILFVVIVTLGQMFRSYLDSSSKPSKSSAIQQLKKVANDLNKECPKTFNDFTTLVSVQFGTNPIPNKREFDTSTHYTEYTYEIPAMLNEEKIAIHRDKMVNNFCSDPVYDFYIDNDFGMHYTYVSDDDTYSSITIPVSKFDCKGFIVSKLNLQEDDKVKSSSAKPSSPKLNKLELNQKLIEIVNELDSIQRNIHYGGEGVSRPITNDKYGNYKYYSIYIEIDPKAKYERKMDRKPTIDTYTLIFEREFCGTTNFYECNWYELPNELKYPKDGYYEYARYWRDYLQDAYCRGVSPYIKINGINQYYLGDFEFYRDNDIYIFIEDYVDSNIFITTRLGKSNCDID